MSNDQFIREAFFLPPAVIEYHVSQSLKQLFPKKACIEVEGGYFDVESYANALWNASLKPALQLSPEGISKISELTADFSFAYLKELFLSSMMQWIARPGQSTMEQVMMSKVATLREQMVSVSTLDEGEIDSQQTRHIGRFRGHPMR